MSEQDTKIPYDHVVGVVPGDYKVDDAKQALGGMGFEDILVMHQVSGTGEDTNPLASLIERLAGHLSDEVAYLDQYKEQAQMGKVIIAVRVEDHQEAERAAEALLNVGAVNVRFFGRFAVSDMSPTSNPSAPSDERP